MDIFLVIFSFVATIVIFLVIRINREQRTEMSKIQEKSNDEEFQEWLDNQW